MRALHANALRQLANLAVAKNKLLLQVGALELLTRFSQRQRQQILLDQRLIRFRRTADFISEYAESTCAAIARVR